MSYPYISDVINDYFGTHLNIPIATFGIFVAIAIMVATLVGQSEVRRYEALGIIPKAKIAPGIVVPVHSLLSELAIIAAIFGVVGARVFHILESPADFLQNPWGMIFSRAGLSIYGGLICGVIAGAIFLKKRAVPIIPMLDALAPSIILGYGIGRIGCQISGDGDWGVAANMSLKPDFVPDWFWAQSYENNIAGVLIENPVYPTPIYESLTAFGLFLLLWAIRKSRYSPGYMFSMYLLLSGFGRLLIEKIRINSEYHLLSVSFTQAEFISVILIVMGLFGVLWSMQTKYMAKIAISLVVCGALTACSGL